jgi:putative oxidoreductase
MSAIPAHPSAARFKTIGFWVLKLLLAGLFLWAGGAKLAGVPAMVEVFEQVGFGQWFRYVTGALEVGGAALLLWPPTVFYGALLLALVSIGAIWAQIFVLHEDVIHAIIVAAVLSAISWTHRKQKLHVGGR